MSESTSASIASTAMAELATPALTTINFPADELGETAARMLTARIDGNATSTPGRC